MLQANFRELGREDISRSLESVSPMGLDVGVDLGDFAELRLYRLGELQQPSAFVDIVDVSLTGEAASHVRPRHTCCQHAG